MQTVVSDTAREEEDKWERYPSSPLGGCFLSKHRAYCFSYWVKCLSFVCLHSFFSSSLCRYHQEVLFSFLWSASCWWKICKGKRIWAEDSSIVWNWLPHSRYPSLYFFSCWELSIMSFLLLLTPPVEVSLTSYCVWWQRKYPTSLQANLPKCCYTTVSKPLQTEYPS